MFAPRLPEECSVIGVMHDIHRLPIVEYVVLSRTVVVMCEAVRRDRQQSPSHQQPSSTKARKWRGTVSKLTNGLGEKE